MPSELSHGLPALITSGNRILQADTMTPILLRGVNRSGLEYANIEETQFTEDEVREIVTGWNANVIRVPFNQHWCLQGRNGEPAQSYLSSLDQVISWAAALGAYTILDLQWLDIETIYGHTAEGRPNHVPPLPNPYTIDLWTTLAQRYRHEPAVLFDLFNEPHDRLEDDPHPLYLIDDDGNIVESDQTRVAPEHWLPWAIRLTEVIRRIRPDGILLIGGVDWAFDLRGIRIDAPNIVYSTHIYPNRKFHAWLNALGNWSDVPLFVGEWGGTDADLEFGRRLTHLLRRLGIGWTAWSWRDHPHLIESPRAPNFKPTPFGNLVRNELLQIFL